MLFEDTMGSLNSEVSGPKGNRCRLSLIGPLPPLRGGIAQHTAALQRALEARCDLHTVPFARLYPGWLFPGKTLYEPEAGQPPGAGQPVVHAHKQAVIDALDPGTWLRAVRSVLDHEATGVVLPWWTVAVLPAIAALTATCRRHGLCVTYICHNVYDHDSGWWKRRLSRLALSLGDRHIVASEREAERLRRLIPDARLRIHPHPVYRHLPSTSIELERRAQLELLFFGIIRPYKGLDVLVDALVRLGASQDWHLTVAGEPWIDTEPLKRRALDGGIDGRIEWIERYVSETEAATLFKRADVVTLPYRYATGCGVLALALGENKLVVASDVPGIREQVVHNQTGWLAPPGDPTALANTLSSIDLVQSTDMHSRLEEAAGRWTWDSLADLILEEIESVGSA